MNELIKFTQNKYIYVPILLWCGIQIYKVLYECIKEKKINLKRVLGAGGMPSSHSAMVAGLATLIGKYEGVDTVVFAVSFIMALVVMYDACGVRRAAGKQAELLNRIVKNSELYEYQVNEKLTEKLGHTPFQVIIGAFIGFVVGLIV